jgi:MFS family permease
MSSYFSRFARWFSTPQSSPFINRRNFVNVQIDAIGVALANAASPFLPVYLAHLGASTLQISLLTTMPAVTGILLAIPLGRILQRQKQIVPWFSGARLFVIMCFALTALISFIIPQQDLPNAILGLWALATVPQTIVAICFTVVMNGVAGPDGRYELMTRRWSLMGIATSITVFSIGQALDKIYFPLNYQVMFIGLSLGGIISYYFSSHLNLPDNIIEPEPDQTLKTQFKNTFNLVRQEKTFLGFILKRFVFLSGVSMVTPLFPIYFVRHIQLSDSWIATITTTQSAVMVLGYYFWSQQSRRRGSRPVLLWTTFGVALYPILVSLTGLPWQIAVYSGIYGIFQAGLDLVFFDELLKTFPPHYSAVFVSVAQTFLFLSAIISPILGSALVDWLGIVPAMIIGGTIRLAGFGLFALRRSAPRPGTLPA